jgi:hypothetical protein
MRSGLVPGTGLGDYIRYGLVPGTWDWERRVYPVCFGEVGQNYDHSHGQW